MATMRGGYVYGNDPWLIEANAAILAARAANHRPIHGDLMPCGTKAARRRHERRREQCLICDEAGRQRQIEGSRRGAETLRQKRRT